MKYTAALALGMVPAALGKAVHNVYPVKQRDGHLAKVEALSNGASVTINGKAGVPATEAQLSELTNLLGLNTGKGVEINFLWVNVGGGQPTTVVNAASTVTVTQTVAGAAATGAAAVQTGAAQAGSPAVAAPASGTVAATGATHSVTVGGPQGLAFSPPQLQAAIGDTVIFTFLSQNHTATQSAFDTPCDPLAGGMDSGFQANPNNTVNPPPQVAMQVMVGTPLWFYCRQNGHCGKGMAFSINPTAEKTHAMFQALAIAQKGTGAGSAITGNGGAAAAPAAPAAPAGSAPAASAPPTEAAAPTAVAGGAAASTGIVTGTGTLGADGACLCAVSCSFGQFPNVAMQGQNAFGGIPGAVPMNPSAAARR
ncbi:hypothetical protein B0H63DRAFT_447840 [Podospora didyma]|uniref:Phytocyanin domain-containing protein n=1 Tax=Podospora didyma TaxID=330526 RepID=A0AAE0NSK7_9PEZI|nr:hypothetical protein B0H63DRAFT_447840 [Podospora didyma]